MSKKILLYTCIVFVLFFTLTLPFPLYLVRSGGEMLLPFFSHLSELTAANLFGIKNSTAQMESDTARLYAHCFNILLLSIITGILIAWTSRRKETIKSEYLLSTSAAYLLAFFLLKYGADKIFKAQFYFPEPNILFTKLGFLSKDILYWSVMGTSRSYSIFAGIIEVIPAFLLFSKRTRLLGGIIAFGVLLNVWMINFSFDISVKLLSSYLLLLSIIIIYPYREMLFGIFIRQENKFQRPAFESILIQKSILQKLIKSFLIAFLLFESFAFYIETGQFNDDAVPRPLFHGAYKTIPTTDTAEFSQLFGNHAALEYLFVHRKGYFITLNDQENFSDFLLQTVSTNDLYLKKGKQIYHLLFYRAGDHYKLTWEEAGKHYILKCKMIPLDTLPVSSKKRNWNVDNFTQSN